MSVTWVQDSNSNYEISSKAHLLQLMHEGALFADAGTPPPSYLSSTYIQTVDIDLASESANIVPIGLASSTRFTGGYDGQGYSISNWSYDAGSNNGTGLFHYVQQCTLKNMVLDGVWIHLNGFDVGFLAGKSNSVTIYNVTTNFAPGTRIYGTSNGYSTGVIIGYGSGNFSNITVDGTIDEINCRNGVGGIAGSFDGSTCTHLRNIATYTTGIVTTHRAGGIAGFCSGSCSHILNAMTGDIVGGSSTGGMFGDIVGDLTDSYISMRGNITRTSSDSGGIAGTTRNGTVFTRVLNYMTGDVHSGITPIAQSSLTLDKCVVAMNGVTTYAAIVSTTGTAEVLLDTSYGITSQFTNDTITTMDVSSFDGVNSNGLPFVSFAYTDPGGNSIDWAFIFGNIDPLSLTAHPLSIGVSFASVDGALAYRITIQKTGANVVTVASSTTELTFLVKNLSPNTEYTIRLYSTSDNSVYNLQAALTTTTLDNVGTNYAKADFENEDGVYDLSGNNTDTLGLINTVLGDVFDTGDELVIPLPGGLKKTSTFVNQGDSYSIVDEDALIISFHEGAGSSQSVSMILSDTTNISVTYDENNDTVDIGGIVYSSGEYTVIDGRKATIRSV